MVWSEQALNSYSLQEFLSIGDGKYEHVTCNPLKLARLYGKVQVKPYQIHNCMTVGIDAPDSETVNRNSSDYKSNTTFTALKYPILILFKKWITIKTWNLHSEVNRFDVNQLMKPNYNNFHLNNKDSFTLKKPRFLEQKFSPHLHILMLKTI